MVHLLHTMNTMEKKVHDGHLAITLDIICNKIPEKKKKDEGNEDFELNYRNGNVSMVQSFTYTCTLITFHINIDILTMTYS